MSAQIQEQLSFLQPVNEREVRKAVVKELKAYKALRVAVQNKKEQEEKGIGQLFTRLQLIGNLESRASGISSWEIPSIPYQWRTRATYGC
ncbi:hypothetical protein [Brevibacillus porteri]|uniref:hypothetical protein n=1 Tax=Brevibacillus porteri TaxID=2126350 RepID=UPI0036449723